MSVKVNEGHGPGWKTITLHVNEFTGETHIDGSVCIGHEGVDCSCAYLIYRRSLSYELQHPRLSGCQCGNPKHPNGAWHPATPIPASWQWIKCFMYWINTKLWGCGCPRNSFFSRRNP